MDEGKRLQDIVRWRGKRKRNEAVRLGDVVRNFVENQVSPRQVRFRSVAEAWSQLLPDELRRHCEIADISGGRLKVIVDLPSYANELRWCGSELVEELAKRCPQARIKEIKFVVG